MPDPRGFLRYDRCEPPRRPAAERVRDWAEVHRAQSPDEELRTIREQAARCMDCGLPFCHSAGTGCPLGNLIPEWNDLVRRDRWAEAADRLHATDNFPEFTGRLCPAPCESACVLARDDHAAGVTVERIERAIADRAWADGRVPPRPPVRRTGRSVAVVGSGPAGLAAAQQLTRAGHAVTVLERADRLGGLLRYGIPAFKMDKALVDRRLAQMRAEGTVFRTGTEAGVDPDVAALRAEFDAVVLAVGAGRARDLPVPGRGLDGVHPAMEFLVAANHECAGDGPTPISAAGRHVVIVGGGDTGTDCFGTALRQGARSVTQLDYRPRPPGRRDEDVTPWPLVPWVLRTAPAHEEGGTRRFEVTVQHFAGSGGRVRTLELVEVDARRAPRGNTFAIPCDLALLAVGFEGVQRGPLLDAFGLVPGGRGTLGCDDHWQTATPGVFVCGDAHRGASLVVWAIAEGRAAAHGVDTFLTGESELPAPVRPGSLHLGFPRFPPRRPG